MKAKNELEIKRKIDKGIQKDNNRMMSFPNKILLQKKKVLMFFR
jgi:hypothetical protein